MMCNYLTENSMKIKESREELMERFKQEGDIFYSVISMIETEDDLDMFAISIDDINDYLGTDECVMMEVDGEQEARCFTGLTFENGTMMVEFSKGQGHYELVPPRAIDQVSLREIADILRRYSSKMFN